MSISLMFVLAVIMLIAVVILMAIAISKAICGDHIDVGEESELGEAFNLILKTYSREEKDKFLNAIDNGEFRDECSTNK